MLTDPLSIRPFANTDSHLTPTELPPQPLTEAQPLATSADLPEDSLLHAETAPGRERIRSGGEVRAEVIVGRVVSTDLPVAAKVLAPTSPAAPGLLSGTTDLGDDIAAPASRLSAAQASGGGIARNDIPSDTFFPNQWHLQNTGQSGGTAGLDLNVTKVWEEFSGAGVTIGIWDDGIEYTHHDLNDNYDTGLHITVGGLLHNPIAKNSNSMHGTAVAGVIAAENNGTGTVGVAWGATIAGVDMFEDPTLDFENSFLELDNFDITNHSWGYTTPFDDNILAAGWSTFFAGWLESVETGRGGLGTINVVAAGNDREDGRDANDSNLNNMPQTIAVAAVSHDGNVSWYSTPGATVLVAAPSNGATGAGVWTTDRTGADGYSNGSNESGNTNADYTSSFGGTSSATPATSGVIALMLEANPNLGWRDVQTILASTARHVGSAIGTAPVGNELYSWTVNGATTWNGGGMHFSNDYGYGLIDALAAVRLAESWTLQSTSANWKQEVAATWTGNMVIPDNNIVGINVNLPVTTDMDLEHVQLKLTWAAGTSWTGDYLITLTSPDGTSSILSRPMNEGSSTTSSWVFTSNQFRGEISEGTWTLNVSDRWVDLESSLIRAELTFHGAEKDADDIWVFTNEFSDLSAGAHGHTTAIADTNGGSDTLNAAAVTSASVINLKAGTGQLDGVAITLSGIEHVVTGDGDDWVRGNAAANRLSGWRGNDTLDGGLGDDTLHGGAGNDTYIVDSAGDRVFETTTISSGIDAGGIDTVRSSVTFGLNAYAGVRFVENLTLTGTGNINGTGNALANRLTGNAGNNVLNGGLGNDTMLGGAGNDTYVVDSAADRVFETTTISSGIDAGGNDRVQSSIGLSLDAYAGVRFVENLILTGTGNINGTGNALANRLTGNTGNNVLNGGLGIDTMLGGAGNDTYVVDAAGDRVFETTTISSGIDAGGIDRVQSAVTFNLDAYAGVRFVENLILTGTDNINGTGNALANRLTGNAGTNVLNGGLGADTMIGGAGKDTFVFNTALGGGNIDRIQDFSVVDDTIRLDDAIFVGLSLGFLSGNAFAANTTGQAMTATDRIIYETDTGRLYFDSDGVDGDAGIAFAIVTAGLELTNADFFVA